MKSKLETIGERLTDERSKRVLFVSHCILNENVRYQGGAFRPGLHEDVVNRARDAGVGIEQLPCPEQRAWGGVRRPWMWFLLGRRGALISVLRGPLVALVLWYTRRVCRTQARAAVRVMADFIRAGYRIVGVLGVGGSPTCGVTETLDLRQGAEFLAHTTLVQLERRSFNRDATAAAAVPGQGFFMAALQREMRRQGISAPFFEDDVLGLLRVASRELVLDLG